MTHWVRAYVHKPWAADADGPDRFSCWGLVRGVFRERRGVLLPWIAVDEEANASEENVRAIKESVRLLGVRRISGQRIDPQEMDIALMSGARLHCGVVVHVNGCFHLLHSTHATGVICQRWSDAIEGSQVEVWRHFS